MEFSGKFERAYPIRNRQYGDGIENNENNEDKTTAFPLLIQAMRKATSKYYRN